MNPDLPHRAKLLFLGAGTWQTPYLQRAKQLNLQVIACDWSPDAAGKRWADVFEPIDVKHREEVLAFAQRNEVEGIFTSADIGVPTGAYVASRMNLPFHPEDVALNASNKYCMRKQAQKSGISIPRFEVASTLDQASAAIERIGCPAIIKPTDNCSSRGVFVLLKRADLDRVFEASIDQSFEKRVLIEELLTGIEGSAEALIVDGKVHVLGICDKIKSDLPYRYDLQLTYPGNYTEEQYKNIRKLLEQLVRGYPIRDGIIHVEFIVNQDNVSLIEFALRGCGSNVITHLVPAMTGFDPVAYLIRMALGHKGPIEFTKNRTGILKFILLRPGEIVEMKGIEHARRCPGIVDFDIEKKAGDKIEIVQNGRERPGYCLAVGSTRNEVERFIADSLSRVKVRYTSNG
jgi:biotin carboxylase